jgi:hypothetical protein
VSELEAIGGDVEDAVARVRVPAYVIDPRGIIRWLNPAARKLVGDVRSQHFTSVVASDVGSGAIIRTLRPGEIVTDARVITSHDLRREFGASRGQFHLGPRPRCPHYNDVAAQRHHLMSDSSPRIKRTRTA